jgi:hypothetical protein
VSAPCSPYAGEVDADEGCIHQPPTFAPAVTLCKAPAYSFNLKVS